MIAITWLVFGQTLRHEFINYDDDSYVYENPTITAGLTITGIARAFTRSHSHNWHPLTTVSHMLDCQFFGLKAGGHHFTNVLLHTLAVVLVFLVFREMTGALWRSAFVAAVYAIHPQHVESVAWIAERKDVLSGVFFMLTLGADVRYARHPSLPRYLTMSILFACGLMSKPMLVTLPFILLLLDYWPLKRVVDLRSLRRTVLEKVPLFVLSAGSSLITFLIQKHGSDQSSSTLLLWRVDNALVSYVTYIRQMVWPVKLAPFYPNPQNQLTVWQITFALVFLFAVTLLVILRRHRNAYLFTGWFWFVVMLVPVIGLVEIGAQGWADRYMYLPQIGLSLIVAWGIDDLTKRWRYRRQVLSAAAAVVIAGLALRASNQTSYWRNSEALWNRTLAVTSQNHVAHNNLGSLLLDRGQIDDALFHHEQALAIRSQQHRSGYDSLLALYDSNVASDLRRKGRPDEAIIYCRQAIQAQPDYAKAYVNLGGALVEQGKIDEAIPVLQRAVKLQPGDAELYNAVAGAFRRMGLEEVAITHYEEALRIDSRSITALNNLAWLLATSVHDSIRDGPRAVTLAKRAVQLSGGTNPLLLHKLAAAYAESGNFPLAIETAEHALQLARDQGNSPLASELEQNIARYRTNSPVRDTRSNNASPSS